MNSYDLKTLALEIEAMAFEALDQENRASSEPESHFWSGWKTGVRAVAERLEHRAKQP